MDNEQATSANPEKSADDLAGEYLSHEDILPLLEDARSKADEHWNQVLRVTADMENLRRRNQRDVENAHKYALERFATELLPIKDSLELALVATASGSELAPEILKLREGVELTQKMLKTAMEKFNIVEVCPVGEKFNPEFHQAMLTQESADAEPNTVLTVYQKGYKLHERLIRPAMVVVAKAPTGSAGNGAGQA